MVKYVAVLSLASSLCAIAVGVFSARDVCTEVALGDDCLYVYICAVFVLYIAVNDDVMLCNSVLVLGRSQWDSTWPTLSRC